MNVVQIANKLHEVYKENQVKPKLLKIFVKLVADAEALVSNRYATNDCCLLV
jgi:hypothetical protein